jgi:hypothetical protein
VNALLDNANRLLETAADCCAAGMDSSDWTIYFGPQGGLQMVAGADQSLESLAWTRGALSAWHVIRSHDKVRVEGRHGHQRCLLEAPAPQRHLRQLLSDVRLYELAA